MNMLQRETGSAQSFMIVKFILFFFFKSTHHLQGRRVSRASPVPHPAQMMPL